MRVPASKATSHPQVDRLIVSNIVEWAVQPERRPLPQFAPPPGSQRFPEEEMALYWSGDRKIVITRHPMDAEHVADIRTILGYESLICHRAPATPPGRSLSAVLATDQRALADLAGLLDEGPADGPVLAEAFGPTPEYGALIAAIRERSRRPVIDRMTPHRHLGTCRSLDSKLAAREYFAAALGQCAAMRLTRAVSLQAGPGVRGQLKEALQAFGPVIVKTEFGAGGQAMGIVRNGRLLRRALGRILPAGYDGGLLVEEFLGTARSALPVSYNGMVQDDGTTYTLCAGRHLVQAGQFYMGTCLGAGAMPEDCAAKVRVAGEAIGAVAASRGYRGPLNVDFLYRAADGVIFPLEVNPRRSLGATLAEICITLFGQGYEKATSAVAMHSVPVHPSITDYGGLRDRLLRAGLFGRQAGLVVLPYMVGSLAVSSNIGLIAASTDGGSAEAAAGEVAAQLAAGPRRR